MRPIYLCEPLMEWILLLHVDIDIWMASIYNIQGMFKEHNLLPDFWGEEAIFPFMHWESYIILCRRYYTKIQLICALWSSSQRVFRYTVGAHISRVLIWFYRKLTLTNKSQLNRDLLLYEMFLIFCRLAIMLTNMTIWGE